MNSTVVEVLKWIGIVFAAGFVGYFGRHLAVVLIDRLRRKKAKPPAPAGEVPTRPPSVGVAGAEAQAKMEKKRAKAAVKRGKRGRG